MSERSPTAVYALKPILDDPKFTTFSFGDLPSLTTKHSREYDFSHFWPKDDKYSIPRLAQKWDCPELRNQEKVAPFNDFPCCGFYVPVFSSRAVNALDEFLRPNGELLPVRTAHGQYFAYQTLTVADGVLDVKKCVGDLRDDARIFSSLDEYAFHKTKLRGLSIFRVRENPSPVLVTNVFKEAVERNRLNGFNFVQQWPALSREERRAAKRSRQQQLGVKVNGKVRGPQDQTVILQLPLKDDQIARPEQKAIEGIRTQLNAELVLKSAEEEYFGSTEGYEIDGGTYRLLISCPDADRLIARLAPLLRKLKWHKPIAVAKRDRPFWDEQASDAPVDPADV